jgi:hypothetical protein
VMLYCWLSGFHCFKGTCLPSSLTFYGPPVQCHIPEDRNFLSLCRINLKTCKIFLSSWSCYITVKHWCKISFVGHCDLNVNVRTVFCRENYTRKDFNEGIWVYTASCRVALDNHL